MAAQNQNPAVGDGRARQDISSNENKSNSPTNCRDQAAERALAVLRCARLKAMLTIAEIDSAGLALRGGLIEPEIAIEWAIQVGAFAFMEGTAP